MKHNWKKALVRGAVLSIFVGAMALPALAAVGQRTATLYYQDIRVTLNGEKLDLVDGRGRTVEPFTIDGTTYLPVAAVSQALGLEVEWDGQTSTVALKSDDWQTQGDYIGVSRAKAIALKHAGLSADQVGFVRVELEYDDGRMEYEVEFWKGITEYDYEIDARTGDILRYDFDIEGYAPSQSSGDIGVEEAKAIALKHAGLSASKVTFLKAKLDYDDGRRVYDVEFYSGTQEYDYEIDAADGAILSCDWDVEDANIGGQSGSYISEAQVRKIVEEKAGVKGTFRKLKLDYDDGRTVYEGEMVSGGIEYEFEVDAANGAVLDWDVDLD